MKRLLLVLVIFLAACGTAAPATPPDLRATLLHQLDQMEAQFGQNPGNNGQTPDQLTAWLILHPELQRYHAWYFSFDTEHIRGMFDIYNRQHTPPDLLRDPAVLDRYFAYLAQQR